MLNYSPVHNWFSFSKSKAIAKNSSNIIEIVSVVFQRLENIVEIGEKAAYHQDNAEMLTLEQVFQM